MSDEEEDDEGTEVKSEEGWPRNFMFVFRKNCSFHSRMQNKFVLSILGERKFVQGCDSQSEYRNKTQIVH